MVVRWSFMVWFGVSVEMGDLFSTFAIVDGRRNCIGERRKKSVSSMEVLDCSRPASPSGVKWSQYGVREF
jgi:hypothetical protein